MVYYMHVQQKMIWINFAHQEKITENICEISVQKLRCTNQLEYQGYVNELQLMNTQIAQLQSLHINLLIDQYIKLFNGQFVLVVFISDVCLEGSGKRCWMKQDQGDKESKNDVDLDL
eukprot:TRINITY_DN10283_c0_g3_i4.p7 TRINITY_DN10283_c0_g3~~TRINITY_DN10283_c0_g3_i4.p7  ORF type:complete len:117 (-),score=5.40 TRINITY_DN10283_c0_g3_i4:96-446(-)